MIVCKRLAIYHSLFIIYHSIYLSSLILSDILSMYLFSLTYILNSAFILQTISYL